MLFVRSRSLVLQVSFVSEAASHFETSLIIGIRKLPLYMYEHNFELFRQFVNGIKVLYDIHVMTMIFLIA